MMAREEVKVISDSGINETMVNLAFCTRNNATLRKYVRRALSELLIMDRKEMLEAVMEYSLFELAIDKEQSLEDLEKQVASDSLAKRVTKLSDLLIDSDSELHESLSKVLRIFAVSQDISEQRRLLEQMGEKLLEDPEVSNSKETKAFIDSINQSIDNMVKELSAILPKENLLE